VAFALTFFFSSRRRHTRFSRDWSSDVCSSDLIVQHRELVAGDIAHMPGMKPAGQVFEHLCLLRIGTAEPGRGRLAAALQIWAIRCAMEPVIVARWGENCAFLGAYAIVNIAIRFSGMKNELLLGRSALVSGRGPAGWIERGDPDDGPVRGDLGPAGDRAGTPGGRAAFPAQ